MGAKVTEKIEGLDKAIEDFFQMNEKSLKDLNPHYQDVTVLASPGPKTQDQGRREAKPSLKSGHAR